MRDKVTKGSSTARLRVCRHRSSGRSSRFRAPMSLDNRAMRHHSSRRMQANVIKSGSKRCSRKCRLKTLARVRVNLLFHCRSIKIISQRCSSKSLAAAMYPNNNRNSVVCLQAKSLLIQASINKCNLATYASKFKSFRPRMDRKEIRNLKIPTDLAP